MLARIPVRVCGDHAEVDPSGHLYEHKTRGKIPSTPSSEEAVMRPSPYRYEPWAWVLGQGKEPRIYATVDHAAMATVGGAA